MMNTQITKLITIATSLGDSLEMLMNELKGDTQKIESELNELKSQYLALSSKQSALTESEVDLKNDLKWQRVHLMSEKQCYLTFMKKLDDVFSTATDKQ